MRGDKDPELRKAFDDFMRLPFPGEESAGEPRDPDEDVDLVPQQTSGIEEELGDIFCDLILYDAGVASCVMRLLGYDQDFDPSLLDDDKHLDQRVQDVLSHDDPAIRATAETYRARLQELAHLVEMCRERIPLRGPSGRRTEERLRAKRAQERELP